MNLKLFKIIQEAERELFDNPFDIGHNYAHHYKVWENALYILIEEKLWDVDREALFIACWFHDLERGDQEHKRMLKILDKYKIPKKTQDKVLEIINSHSYEDKNPTISEAKVLFDADKIEYINVSRWHYFRLGFEAGNISKKRMIHDGQLLSERLLEIVKRINYQTTHKIFATYLKRVKDYLDMTQKESELVKHTNMEILENALEMSEKCIK